MSKHVSELLKLFPRDLLKNPLFTGSVVFYIGVMFVNLSAYLYHFLMARMLGVVNYGILDSLLSVLYLLTVPVGVIGIVITKFVSSYKGQRNVGAISSMLSTITKKSFLVGLVVFVFFLVFVNPLSSFLHMESAISLVLVGLIGFVAIFNAISRAFLQGILSFRSLSLSGVIEALLKLFVAIPLVLFGLGVDGAVLSILISGFAGYIFTMFMLKRFLGRERAKESVNYVEMLHYSLPTALSLLAFTSLITADVILARHYLPAVEAGYYAALSVLGKIVFFAASPITTVMFPVISERHTNGKHYTNILFWSLGLVLLVSAGVTFLYVLFPELMIKILFGEQYLSASSYLPFFALFLSFYSLSSLLTNFYLSIKELKIANLSVLAALTQIVLIVFFHQSILQIVFISMVINALLFFSQMLYCVQRLWGNVKFSYEGRN